MNQFPPGYEVSYWGNFDYLPNFAEIFVSNSWSSVSTTPAIIGKNFETGSFFLILFRCCWVASYIHIMIFYFLFSLRFRQAGDVDTGEQLRRCRSHEAANISANFHKNS